MFSNTFAGIKPSSAPAFIVFQFVGMVVAVAAIWVLYPDGDQEGDAIVPHEHDQPLAAGVSRRAS